MKSLPFIIIFAFFLFFATETHAKTSINISNNGEGSNTSVNVRQSTGGNYINGQEVTTNNGSSHTRVEVNGEVLIDKTTEGGNETNVSVKQEGGKKPEVTYEVKKNSAVVKQEVKSAQDTSEIKNEVKVKTSASGTETKTTVAKTVKQETLLSRIESLFDKLRNIFSS